MLDQKQVRALLDYDAKTGIIRWKPRPLKSFATKGAGKIWNSRFSGCIAGRVYSNNATRYRIIAIYSKAYYAHRLVFLWTYGNWPVGTIDHIDGDGFNNRLSNLRDVSHQENHRNIAMPANNTSGIVGVCWGKARNKWLAQIQVKGKTINLGRFTDKADAVLARKIAEAKYGFSKTHGLPRKVRKGRTYERTQSKVPHRPA